MKKLFLAVILISLAGCKTTYYKWNTNGRIYLPVNPTFEDENWKIIIKEINETEEVDNTNKLLKIRISFQNKAKKYRMLKLMSTTFTEYNFNYMKRNNNNGIADIHNQNPEAIDFDHLYRKAGIMVKLKSKMKDRPERFNWYFKNFQTDSESITLSCDGSNSGNDERRPNSASEWLAPGQIGEEYIRCSLPQGMIPTNILSDGDFDIPLKEGVFYHTDIEQKYGEFIK
ncbi:hypothetical protein P3G55_17180 [Leptospira sp. 96542]|nr:hypothetical protein [Leptospira sp. 96542]